MRLLIAAIASLCLLAGCTTIDKIDTAVAYNLPKICSAATIAHAAFTTAVAVEVVSASTARKEGVAWASLELLCTDPANQTAAGVLVTAALAYATITKALKEADRNV